MRGLMSCKFWKSLAWMFFATVFLESLYTGVKFHCWLGLAACAAGFVGGLVYGRFRKEHC